MRILASLNVELSSICGMVEARNWPNLSTKTGKKQNVIDYFENLP